MGAETPGELAKDDTAFDTYRKRMMLAYRFRPNPLVGVCACACVKSLLYLCPCRVCEINPTTCTYV